jgi:hypothetical protein
MKCPNCEHDYLDYKLTQNLIYVFCDECNKTTWIIYPKYLPKEQKEKFADNLFTKDHIPQHLIYGYFQEG